MRALVLGPSLEGAKVVRHLLSDEVDVTYSSHPVEGDWDVVYVLSEEEVDLAVQAFPRCPVFLVSSRDFSREELRELWRRGVFGVVRAEDVVSKEANGANGRKYSELLWLETYREVQDLKARVGELLVRYKEVDACLFRDGVLARLGRIEEELGRQREFNVWLKRTLIAALVGLLAQLVPTILRFLL